MSEHLSVNGHLVLCFAESDPATSDGVGLDGELPGGGTISVGFDMETAARIANAAGGVVVGKRGTATCSLEELKAAMEMPPLPPQDMTLERAYGQLRAILPEAYLSITADVTGSSPVVGSS